MGLHCQTCNTRVETESSDQNIPMTPLTPLNEMSI